MGMHVFAQDFHLSQYWASPLNLNPALSGLFDNNVRFAANYRNQWFQHAKFTTYAVSVDANLWRNKLNGSFVGTGLGFYYDTEGGGEFSNMGVNIPLSYTQHIKGRNVNQYIGFGLQGTYYNKQINLTDLVFGNLFEINSNTDPIDFTNYNRQSLFDFGAGINYFISIDERHAISTGFAISHIAQPNISFANNSEDVLYRKFSANMSAKLQLNGNFISIIPTMLFQKQGPHKELDFGSYVKFMINDYNNMALYIGAQYRMSAYENNNFGSDAVILGVRADIQNFDLGFSYDVTTSDLRNAAQFMGGPELYVIYTIKTAKSRYREKLNCPKF